MQVGILEKLENKSQNIFPMLNLNKNFPDSFLISFHISNSGSCDISAPKILPYVLMCTCDLEPALLTIQNYRECFEEEKLVVRSSNVGNRY